MRVIVRNRAGMHIWNVNDYIKQTQANIVKQDTHKYITLQKIFRKVYLRHLHDHHRLRTYRAQLDNLLLLAPAPARSIADHFHHKVKEYSEPILAATFQAIASAYQVSKADHSGSLDTLGYQLFLSSEFSNLSEEAKYALRNNKASLETVLSLLDSLLKLEYVDHELLNLVLLYTKREIEGGEPYSRLTGWEGDREFQIEKKGYYDPKEEEELAALRGSEEVATAISFVRHIYREWKKGQEVASTLRKLNIAELSGLVEEIARTNLNFRKLVEAVINIRRQYAQMVEFSREEQLLRNPNLNLELLELEERLMATRLITVHDIKDPRRICDPETEVQQVEEVILRVLDVHRLDPIFAFVDKALVEVVNEREQFLPNPARIAGLLSRLAKLAELDRHVYHSKDGKSLVSLKWEKTLVPQKEGKELSSGVREELNVSRIYRRVYQEVSGFLLAHAQRLAKIFKGSVLSSKVELIDAFFRVGLNEQALQYVGTLSNGTFVSSLKALPHGKFETFMRVLNDGGIFVSDPSFHDAVFKWIEEALREEERNEVSYGLAYSIDAVNYLLQNHRAHPGFAGVYGRELRMLEAKARYVTVEERENEGVVEAFKILALEEPEKFGSHPIYLEFLGRCVRDEYKRNPFQAILREAVFKWAQKEGSLRLPQNYLIVGVNNGLQNGIVFSSSDETSLDGTIRSGNLNSYIMRLELKNGVRINELPLNAFLGIDYSAPSLFTLRPLHLLRAALDDIFQHRPEEFDQVYSSIQANLIAFLQYYRGCLIADRIRFKLVVLNRLRVASSSLETKEQEYSSKARFLLEILELSKLVALLNEKDILASVPRPQPVDAPINEKLRGEEFQRGEKEVIEVDLQSAKMLLREVKVLIPDLLDSLSKYMGEQGQFLREEGGYLKGERQSIELLGGEGAEQLNLTLEMINHPYYNDKSYCEYRDWRERISRKYHCAELDYHSASNLTKILANKLCGDVTNKLNLLPLTKHEDRVHRLSLDFKVFPQQAVGQPERQQAQGLGVGEGAEKQKELEYIINLQNFKHELKTLFSGKEVIDYIFGFRFVHDLHTRHPEKGKLLLKRNAEDYFNYLEELNEKNYLDSPYAKYIIEKLGKTDKIRTLLEERRILRINLRLLYQKGLIDGREYYARVGEVEEQIVEAAKELRTKMLDHMEDTLLEGELKMVQVRQEELEAFEDILNKQFGYSRHFDQDFVHANGDFEAALQLKRGRAQSNYVKLYLLRRIGENQQLDNREKMLLKEWHEDIVRGVSESVVYPAFTTVQISDLSWEDLQRLRLKHSQLSANKDMLLVDLILEFNSFLDPSLILAYEREVKAEYLAKHFHLPAFLFRKTNNSAFRALEVETESAIVDQQAKLSEKELDKVEELFKVYKAQGFRERTRYSRLCKDFRGNIAQMNEQMIRNELIGEYVKHLEVEFYKEYDPALVAEIKERETDKLWRSVFQLTYESTPKDLLKEVTKKLILRLEVVGQNPPPFFGNLLLKLLLHPLIDSHSRESLIAAIEINRFDLKLDSADIEGLSKLRGKEVRRVQEVAPDMRVKGSVMISKELRAKAKNVV